MRARLGLSAERGMLRVLHHPGGCKGPGWRRMPQLEPPTSTGSKERLLQCAEAALGKPNEGVSI